MTKTIIMLIIILILILLIYYYIKRIDNKFRNFLRKYFGTDNLKSAIDNSKPIEENTPKSISSLESLIIPKIQEDFNDLNINEIKALAEDSITYMFNAIESKKMIPNKKISDEVITMINSKINDLNESTVHFDSIKFHKTVVKDYENKNNIVNLKLASSLEYMYSINNGDAKKVQTRIVTEFIYIIDSAKVHQNKRNIGLNCPNCGAPIENAETKFCKYCGSGLMNIVKRVWILNNIREY